MSLKGKNPIKGQLKHTKLCFNMCLPFVYQRKQNAAYVELCKNRLGNDRYTSRMMQTLNGAPKTKEVQCDKILIADKGK